VGVIVDAAFAIDAVHYTVDGKAVVRVFVEKQITPAAVSVRPRFAALTHGLIFDQRFEQITAFSHARFGVRERRPCVA
jgi:hypothetical protein